MEDIKLTLETARLSSKIDAVAELKRRIDVVFMLPNCNEISKESIHTIISGYVESINIEMERLNKSWEKK